MANVLKITIPIPPSINNDYMKPRAIIKRGKPMAMMYETKVAKDFKKRLVNQLLLAIKEQGFIPDKEKYTRLEWTWYFARVNQDTNNYYKIAIDSVTECKEIWKDDNISLNHDKRIYYDSKNPRVEIEIYYENWIGIFDNDKEYKTFLELNCNECKRGMKGNCSIHKKALANKIQEDIVFDEDVGFMCLKKSIKK